MKRLLLILIVLTTVGCCNSAEKRAKIDRMNRFVGETLVVGDKKVDILEYRFDRSKFRMTNGDYLPENYVINKLSRKKNNSTVDVRNNNQVKNYKQDKFNVDFRDEVKKEVVEELIDEDILNEDISY